MDASTPCPEHQAPATIDPRTLYAFVESRIKRGMFDAAAFTRAARSISTLGRPSFRPTERSGSRPTLRVRPVPFGQAAAFCAVYHRHLKPPAGHVFSLGVFAGRRLVGVAIVGRPVARHLDDGCTLEITRVASDGTRNACSALLGACRRESRRRSIKRLVTYTLPSEPGISLRAAGFRADGMTAGGRWDRNGRPRQDAHPVQRKLRCLA